MKKSYYLIVLVLILGLALTGCSLLSDISQVPATEQSGIPYLTKHTVGDPFVTDLLAGQTIDVGDVLVWNDSDYLYVKYVVDAVYWCLTETHLAVAANSLDGIPQTKKNNPIPGQFPYQCCYDEDEGEWVFKIKKGGAPEATCDADENTDATLTTITYTIPLPLLGTEPVIAAHAVVCQLAGNFIAGLNLPETVTFMVTFPYAGGPAYFPHTYINGLSIEELDVYGWCVDTGHSILQNTMYTAYIYSSYDETLPDLMDHPENLDLVNWILNQGFVGQLSACDGGTHYTYGDVQRAIWALIEDIQSTAGLGAWSQCRVNEILAAADANGEDFEPGCGDIIVVILEPVNGEQIIIGEIVIECGCETAWGDGEDFSGKNWATYIEKYEVQQFNQNEQLYSTFVLTLFEC